MTLEDRLTEAEAVIEDLLTALAASGDNQVVARVRALRDNRKQAQQGGPQS